MIGIRSNVRMRRDNTGFTLVELLVVIADYSGRVGVPSHGGSMGFGIWGALGTRSGGETESL